MNFRKVMMNILVTSAVLFATTNGFCEENSLVVDETGNVGIGTGQPTSRLEVVKTGQDTIRMSSDSPTALGEITSGISFGKHQGHYDGYRIYGINRNTGNGQADLNFDRFFNSTSHETVLTLKFNGNVGIGTSNPDAKLKVTQKTDTTALKVDLPITGLTSPAFQILYDGTESTAPLFNIKSGSPKTDRLWVGANGNIGINDSSPQYKLDVNGTIRGNNVSPSDARWKTNVAPLENTLDKVSKLRGVRYEWSDVSKGLGKQIGVIAQEVEAVFPEAVSTDDQGYKSVAYAKLVAPLIEAVKELKKENAALKQRIQALENR